MIGFTKADIDRLHERWPDDAFLSLDWHLGELRFQSLNDPDVYLHHYIAQSQKWFGGYVYDDEWNGLLIGNQPTDHCSGEIRFPIAILKVKE